MPEPELPVGDPGVRQRGLRALKRPRRRVGGAVVGQDDLRGEGARAEELRAAREARLKATRLVVCGKDEAEDFPL